MHKLFSGSPKYYFLLKTRYVQWNLLNFELVSMWYFIKKSAGFYFLINLKFRKVLTSLLAFLALPKNKNSEASRLIVGTSPPRPPHHSQCYISLSVWCVFCSFTPFLSVLFVFHRKSLVLLHLMNRYTASTIEHFFKKKILYRK